MADYDKHNHDQYEHDLSFSSPGDIDRMTGDGTSERSRDANAQAAASINEIPTWERATFYGPEVSPTANYGGR